MSLQRVIVNTSFLLFVIFLTGCLAALTTRSQDGDVNRFRRSVEQSTGNPNQQIGGPQGRPRRDVETTSETTDSSNLSTGTIDPDSSDLDRSRRSAQQPTGNGNQQSGPTGNPNRGNGNQQGRPRRNAQASTVQPGGPQERPRRDVDDEDEEKNENQNDSSDIQSTEIPNKDNPQVRTARNVQQPIGNPNQPNSGSQGTWNPNQRPQSRPGRSVQQPTVNTNQQPGDPQDRPRRDVDDEDKEDASTDSSDLNRPRRNAQQSTENPSQQTGGPQGRPRRDADDLINLPGQFINGLVKLPADLAKLPTEVIKRLGEIPDDMRKRTSEFLENISRNSNSQGRSRRYAQQPTENPNQQPGGPQGRPRRDVDDEDEEKNKNQNDSSDIQSTEIPNKDNPQVRIVRNVQQPIGNPNQPNSGSQGTWNPNQRPQSRPGRSVQQSTVNPNQQPGDPQDRLRRDVDDEDKEEVTTDSSDLNRPRRNAQQSTENPNQQTGGPQGRPRRDADDSNDLINLPGQLINRSAKIPADLAKLSTEAIKRLGEIPDDIRKRTSEFLENISRNSNSQGRSRRSTEESTENPNQQPGGPIRPVRSIDGQENTTKEENPNREQQRPRRQAQSLPTEIPTTTIAK